MTLEESVKTLKGHIRWFRHFSKKKEPGRSGDPTAMALKNSKAIPSDLETVARLMIAEWEKLTDVSKLSDDQLDDVINTVGTYTYHATNKFPRSAELNRMSDISNSR